MTRKLQNRRDSNPATARRTGTAFTLIELLVVISIISILIAILLPALAKARDSARTIQCAANQHQLAIAFVMYQDASEGYFPANDKAAVGQVQWDDRLGTYDGRQLSQGQKNRVYINTNNPGVLYKCPADLIETDITLRYAGIGFRRTYAVTIGVPGKTSSASRGIAGPYHNTSGGWAQNTREIRKTSRTIVLGELPFSKNVLGYQAGDTMDQVGISNRFRNKSHDVWPHGVGRSNWLFVDGHSQLLPFDATLAGSPAANNPENVGWSTSMVGSMWDTWK